MRFSFLNTHNDRHQGHGSVHPKARAFIRRRNDSFSNSARVSSSPRSRRAGAFSSSLALAHPFSLSALFAARVRLSQAIGTSLQLGKQEYQLASQFIADLNHAASPANFDEELNTLIKAGVAGNEVPNFR